MRLTRFTDLGLRACMRMAGQPGRSFSAADLAEDLGVSRHHLAKAVATLAAAGIVRTRRGAGGGAMLARPANRLRVGEIIYILEQRSSLDLGIQSGVRGCALAPDRQLKIMFAGAKRAFINHLNQFTLADCALLGAGILGDAKYA